MSLYKTDISRSNQLTAVRPLHSAEIIRVRAEIVGNGAGRAGVLVSIGLAFLGIILGASVSYIAGQSNKVEARYSGFSTIKGFEIESEEPFVEGVQDGNRNQSGDKLRPAIRWEQNNSSNFEAHILRNGAGQLILREGVVRQKIVEEVLRSGNIDTSSFPIPVLDGAQTRAKVAIIIDDVGLDRRVFDQLIDLPGPVTYSFLPYADNLQPMVEQVKEQGGGVMLHLPMEPVGNQNPGPHALRVETSRRKLDKDLTWNLNRFTGFTGVNNHMGSKFTADQSRMARVLQALKKRDLYFVDSVTGPNSRAQSAARETGTVLLRRDVFLDSEASAIEVKRQLAQVEEIARRTGYAIAIAHPYDSTIEVIGPWLASARLRGFDIVTVDALVAAGLGDFNLGEVNQGNVNAAGINLDTDGV